MTVSERIRSVRISKGLTQKALSEKCGIAEPTIRSYELARLNPKPSTLQKIADAIDLPLSFFTATPPFEDLRFLDEYKSVLLCELSRKGLIDLDNRPIVDVGNYEYWKCIADHILSIVKIDTGLLNIQYLHTKEVKNEVLSFETSYAELDFGAQLERLVDSGHAISTYAILRMLGELNEYGIRAAEQSIIDLSENPDYKKAPDATNIQD